MRGWWRTGLALATIGIGVGMAGVVAAAAQDPLRTLPKNYWVEFENPWLKVIHVRYGPHEKVGVHDHPATPTLYVYLSDSGPVRFEHAGEDTFDLTRRPLVTGQMRVSPGRRETHKVENLGDQQSDFLRVEFTTLPMGLKDFEERIPAADAAFWQKPEPAKLEFEAPHLTVTRLGLQPGRHFTFGAPSGGKSAWLVLRGEGATVAGKPVHAGETWSGPELALSAGSSPAEIVRLDLK